MRPVSLLRRLPTVFACTVMGACGAPSHDSEPGHAATNHGNGGYAADPLDAGIAHAATGVVESVDRDNNTAVIHHDPVLSIGMPEMTMTFRLADPAMADQLRSGERIGFEFMIDDGVVVTAIHGTESYRLR
jgi:Cu/Ag efflux protein CusF